MFNKKLYKPRRLVAEEQRPNLFDRDDEFCECDGTSSRMNECLVKTREALANIDDMDSDEIQLLEGQERCAKGGIEKLSKLIKIGRRVVGKN